MNAGNKKRVKRALQGVLLGFVFLLVLLGSLVLLWAVRPNTSRVNPHLEFSSWTAVSNGRHNANTDLVRWRGHYYFIYANQPGNQGSTSTFLSVNRGMDLHDMTEVAQLRVPGEDIRDPKFAVMGDQLFIFYLKNRGFMADPYTTAFVNSSDGLHFSEAREVVGLEGWLFWRPKTLDNVTWYCTASSAPQRECVLLKSTDGFNWTKVSSILKGTGLAVAAPPYLTWNYTLDKLTKFDGPALFNLVDPSNGTR
ncbi:MAG: hypothetical protein ACTSU5_21655 [Promethearchaeota archaeon]